VYEYVGGRSIRQRDPTGLIAERCCEDAYCCGRVHALGRTDALLGFGSCMNPLYPEEILVHLGCAGVCFGLVVGSPAFIACMVASEDAAQSLQVLIDSLYGNPSCWERYKDATSANDFRYCACRSAKERLCRGRGGDTEENLTGVSCATLGFNTPGGLAAPAPGGPGNIVPGQRRVGLAIGTGLPL
jgi:hypothetical protein